MDYRRDYTPAAYGADYLQNLRWRYRTTYGDGSASDPYRGGGSFGRGYRRSDDVGFRSAAPGPRPPRGYAAPYYTRHPGGYRHPPWVGYRYRAGAAGWRPGTALREYGYPYFGSAAVAEAAQGYPPADTLNPETYPSPLGWGVGDYGEEYEPPGVLAARPWRRIRGGGEVRGRRPRETVGRRRRRRRRTR